MQQLAQDAWAYVSTTTLGAIDMALNPVRNATTVPEPDPAKLQGKVCVITGGNAGIGFATAKLLKRNGAHVVLACRDRSRAAAAAQEVAKVAEREGIPPGGVEVMELDLASLDSVRRFCAAFRERGLPLDFLLCNAGLMAPPQRLVSKDGLEMQLQVNYLAHWQLVHGLLAEQRSRRQQQQQNGGKGAKGSGCSGGTRVVLFSSVMHHLGARGILDPKAEKRYVPVHSYGFSKLAAIMAARELQRRFTRNPEWGADSAVAVHPGVVDTHLAHNFFQHEYGSVVPRLLRPAAEAAVRGLVGVFSLTPAKAAELVVQALVAPDEVAAGRYVAHGKVARPHKLALDDAANGWLWEWSARLTGTDIHPSLL